MKKRNRVTVTIDVEFRPETVEDITEMASVSFATYLKGIEQTLASVGFMDVGDSSGSMKVKVTGEEFDDAVL